MNQAKLQRIIDVYFNQPERRVMIPAGETILVQGENNERLYYVCSGELEGFIWKKRRRIPLRCSVHQRGRLLAYTVYFLKRSLHLQP